MTKEERFDAANLLLRVVRDIEEVVMKLRDMAAEEPQFNLYFSETAESRPNITASHVTRMPGHHQGTDVVRFVTGMFNPDILQKDGEIEKFFKEWCRLVKEALNEQRCEDENGNRRNIA